MQKLLTLLICFSSVLWSSAQNFSGTGGSIPASNVNPTCFTINVTGVGNINSSTNGLASVCFTITHPDVVDLEVLLRAPDGTTVPLTIQNGGTGNNYTNTCFSATATNSIKTGTAPFTGTFIPEGHLGAVNNGQNANGAWRLCIADRRNTGSSGVLNSWNLSFSNTPAPAPPAYPACATTLPTSSSCTSATAICDFNGLCGSIAGNTVQDWSGSGLDGCFGLQNNSFLKFTASAATASFTVWVPTNSAGPNGGIQMLFFSGTCGSGAVTTHGCYPHIFPSQGAGDLLSTIITATGLTPGNTYYLMFDGFGGDVATFRIAANSGVNVLDVTPDSTGICNGGSVNLTASGGNNVYAWSPANGLSATSGTTITASPNTTTTYTVSSVTTGGCPLTKTAIVTVNDTPVVSIQPKADTTRLCQNGASISLSVTATPGSGTISYQWFVTTSPNNTSGAAIPFATNSTYTPSTSGTGTLFFYCRISNSNGCITRSNVSGPVIISAAVATPVAAVTQQPNCLSPTGIITVSSPMGANFEYSSGGAYQASPVLSGLAPDASYNVTVRNRITGCTSPATVEVINALPTPPPAPTGSVTQQPDCINTTGTITLTNPIGANYEYSAGGGNYEATTSFTGLINGTTYNITVRDIFTGCVSDTLKLTINTIPGAPPTPVATVTIQPTCTLPSGTIVVTSPLATDIEYSLGGSNYQVTPSFSGIAPGTYALLARNSSSGCISAPLSITVDTVPNLAQPTADILSQPTCVLPIGNVLVTSPQGANIQYSLNGGPFNTSVFFAALTPGNYSLVAQNTATGCLSPALPFTINAVPAKPVPATFIVTQPTCTVNTGTITITNPLGTNFQYSITNAYQSTTTFAGLPASSAYFIKVKDTITGCISDSVSVSINALPTLAALTATVTTAPTCLNPTGTITITAPLGASVKYSIGGSSQLSPIFTALPAGTSYALTATDTLTGCSSTPVNISIPSVPQIASPLVNILRQPDCITPTGSISIISPLGASIKYSIGGTFQTNPGFTGLAPNTIYNVQAQDTINGCLSLATSVVMAPLPTVATPTATVSTQPTCAVPTGTIAVTAPTGSFIKYSIGGSYQLSPVFAGLSPNNTYSVRAQDTITGCLSLVTSVTIATLPTVATPTATVSTQPTCSVPTGTITITAPIGPSIKYSVGGSYQLSPVFAGLAASTSYSVTARDTLNGCTSTALVLAVNAVPVTTAPPTVVSPVIYCENASPVPLTATGSNLLWYSSATGGTGSSTAPTPSTSTPGTTFYYVSQTIGGCESVRTAITVTVNAVITPTVGFRYNPDTVCRNGVNPGPQYTPGFTFGGTFASQPGLTINTSNGNINLASSIPRTYVVVYNYSPQGCTLAGSFSDTITILPPEPTVTLFSYSAPICKDDANPSPSFAANFTQGGFFTASPGLVVDNNTGQINLAASGTGVFQVTYSLPAQGCRQATSNFSFVNITANTTPQIGFNYTPATVCPSDNAPIINRNVGFVNGGTFTAAPSGLAINAASGAIDVAASTPGTYVVTYSVVRFGCRLAASSSDTFIIRSTAPAVTSFSYNTPVCKTADSIPATKSAGFTEGGIFQSTSTGLRINSANGLINPSLSLPGTYTILYILPATSCTPPDTGRATIQIVNEPAAPTITPVPVCKGNSTTLTAGGAGTIRWYSNEQLNVLLNTGSTYTTNFNENTRLFLTATIGTCTSLPVPADITVSNKPTVSNLGKDTTLCNGDALQLNPGIHFRYEWQDGSTASIYNITESGSYYVTVFNSAGCSANSDTVNINLLSNCDDIQFPNSFSPNGDGLNERFGPLGNLFVASDYQLRIFNRYGELVFSTNNPYLKWDGNFKGKNLGNNSFAWVATYNYRNRIKKTKKGTVTIIR